MIYKRQIKGTSKTHITFELPVELHGLQCSLVGDFNEWDPSADVFDASRHFRICKELERDNEYEFLYLSSSGEYFQDYASDGVRHSGIGTNSVVNGNVYGAVPMSSLGLDLPFTQQQLVGIVLLLLGFVGTLYIFAIYTAFHGASFRNVILLPFDPSFKEKAFRIIESVGNYDFVSFQENGLSPTYFALFLEVYTWCALGVLSSQVYEIYRDIVIPGPVLTLSHVASWLRTIMARPPIAAVIILLLEALDITISGQRVSSIGTVMAVSFLSGFSGSFSDELVLAFMTRIKQSVVPRVQQKVDGE